MTTVKAQRRIRVSVKARTTSVMLINLILLVVIRMMVTVVAFTYNPSVVSHLLPSETTQQSYGYSSCRRPWCQRFKLRDSSLRWYEKQQCEYFSARQIIYQRAIYPVLQIASSGLIEEPESFTTPDCFYGEDGEEEDEMTAEVMDVSPEDLASAASTIEKNENAPHRPTPEEQYWSVFGHEKGFLDGPLNPMHQRRELLEHLENHLDTVKNVMQKRVSATTTTIPEGRGGEAGATTNSIKRLGSSMQKTLVTGMVDGSMKGGNAVARLQPLIGGETSIEGHLQALFDANIVDYQGDQQQHAQSANVLNWQNNGTSTYSTTNLPLAAEKQIQHDVVPDLSNIYDEKQKQYQVPDMSSSTSFEVPRNDSMGSRTFPPQNNDETIVAAAAAPLRFDPVGETGVEVEYDTKPTTSLHQREMVRTAECNSKSTMVEGSGVPPPNSMMRNRENKIHLLHWPNPKLKPQPSESRIAINEMVKLYVKEGDLLFEDRMLCPRCSAPCREDELKLNGGCCTACHSEDVSEEFCVNYAIQKKSSLPHFSTRGRMTNSTTARGGAVPPPLPVSSSTTKKSKTFPRPSDVPPLPGRVSTLERKIKQLLNNTSNIIASLKRLESRLNITTSVYTPHSKKKFIESSPSAGGNFPVSPSDHHHLNKAVLKAANRGSSGNSKMFNNNTRNSKALEGQSAKVVLPLVRDDESVVNRGQKNTVAIDMVERWRRSRAKIGKQQKTHKRQAQTILDEN